MEAKATQYLDRILNKQISAIGRASNMLWLGIGDKIMVVNSRGLEVEKSTFHCMYNQHGELSTMRNKK